MKVCVAAFAVLLIAALCSQVHSQLGKSCFFSAFLQRSELSLSLGFRLRQGGFRCRKVRPPF